MLVPPEFARYAGPYLGDHMVAFGRMLRRIGLRVGTLQIMDAVRAVKIVGLQRREDVRQALYGVFVRKPDHIDLFDQAFDLFWAAARAGSAPRIPLPTLDVSVPKAQRRVKEALREQGARRPRSARVNTREIEHIIAEYSAAEALRQKDFAAYTSEEVAMAKMLIQSMHWPIVRKRVRRHSSISSGRRLHLRSTLRRSMRYHGEVLELRTQGPKTKPRPIVVLCDISGSMESYSRMLLHFMHAVTQGMGNVESFVFGTRLTRITRLLRTRDVDEAVTATSRSVCDWGGGTRIGEALKEFNFRWLRRVMRAGGVALIISDGCDRGDIDLLGREMARLHRSCHRLIWLNPLLGYAEYEPLTRGMLAALPHVTDFLAIHNLEALDQLGAALQRLKRRPSRTGAPQAS